MDLIDLHVDIQIHIYNFLSNRDLLKLCNVSPHLKDIIVQYVLPVRTRHLLMCGHRCAPRIVESTQLPFTYLDRLKVNRNWLQGTFREYQYFPHEKENYVKLHLDRDWLYMSLAENFGKIRRMRMDEEPLRPDFERQPEIKAKANICGFVKRDDTIFVGRVDGNCSIYESGVVTDHQLNMIDENLLNVDFANDIYVTNNVYCTRIWRRSNELNMMREIREEYRSLRLNDRGDRFYCSLSFRWRSGMFREYDVESGVETKLGSDTHLIFDLKIKDEHVIFTVNLDNTLRMFDRRANDDVHTWTYKYGWTRLEYDGQHAVLCAGKLQTYVHLIDIRVPKTPVRSYYLRNNDSNIRIKSIACDGRYLFAATNSELRVLDFNSGRDAIDNSIPKILPRQRTRSN